MEGPYMLTIGLISAQISILLYKRCPRMRINIAPRAISRADDAKRGRREGRRLGNESRVTDCVLSAQSNCTRHGEREVGRERGK